MALHRIAIDDDVPQNHHARLTEGGEMVPAGSIIELVHGDGAEPSSLEFLQRLKEAAALIGSHTDVVRAAVKQNADALKNAAEQLHEADEASVAALRSTTTVIDQTAADTTAADVQAGSEFLLEEQAAAAERDAAAATDPASTTPEPAPSVKTENM